MEQKNFLVFCQKKVYASIKHLRPSSLISISAPNLEIGPQGFIYASKCGNTMRQYYRFIYASKCGNTIDAFSETD